MRKRRSQTRWAIWRCAAVALLALGLGSAGLAPAQLGGAGELRISEMGPDGDTSRAGEDSAIAYNTAENEYLVVWEGDPTTDDEFEIYGQLISATGDVVKDDFQISDTIDSANRDAWDVDVAYNSTDNEYLVVWESDELAGDEFEIFGQRLEADGSEPTAGSETGNFQISSMAGGFQDAFDPAVAYSSVANEYLVTWESDQLADQRFEVFGQRLEADGSEPTAGSETGDFQISSTSGSDFDASGSAVAYNPAADEYLVVWNESMPPAGSSDNAEVLGQRVDSDGAKDGSDFQVSQTADPANARDPGIAYNANDAEYLVAWEANPAATGSDYDVFGQRVSATGAEVGPSDFRISHTTDAGSNRGAGDPVIAHDPVGNEYLVAWEGDETADNEHEIHGQRVSRVGAEIGSDFRISNATDTGDGRDAFEAATVYNPTAEEFLVTWDADQLPTPNEKEIFGRRLTAHRAPPPGDTGGGDTGGGTSGGDTGGGTGGGGETGGGGTGADDTPPFVPPEGDRLRGREAKPFDMRLEANGRGVIRARLSTSQAGRFRGHARTTSRVRVSSSGASVAKGRRKPLSYRKGSVRSRPGKEVRLVLKPTRQLRRLLSTKTRPEQIRVEVRFHPRAKNGRIARLREVVRIAIDRKPKRQLAPWIDVSVIPSVDYSELGRLATYSGDLEYSEVKSALPGNRYRLDRRMKRKAVEVCKDGLKPTVQVFGWKKNRRSKHPDILYSRWQSRPRWLGPTKWEVTTDSVTHYEAHGGWGEPVTWTRTHKREYTASEIRVRYPTSKNRKLQGILGSSKQERFRYKGRTRTVWCNGFMATMKHTGPYHLAS